MMKVICAANAIKETLSVRGVQRALVQGAINAGCKKIECLLLSDGGDGFADAFFQSDCNEVVYTVCEDPLGRGIQAPVSWDVKRRRAVIESANVIGLKLISPGERSIMESSSAGLGDLVYQGMEQEASEIVIGLGGSATCDGGAGMLLRLAERLGILPVSPSNSRGAPAQLFQADWSFLPMLRKRLRGINLLAFADVRNPLRGPHGTAHTFAWQKGASPGNIRELERILAQYAEDVHREIHSDFSNDPGAGAAGGLGFAFMICGGRLVAGIDQLCRQIGFEQMVSADCHVVTCEGKFDMSSLNGKAPSVIGELAVKTGARVTIFCAVADQAAASIAGTRGMEVVEFGHHILPDQRKSQTSGALAAVVQAKLQNS